jgi:hypothetical protein
LRPVIPLGLTTKEAAPASLPQGLFLDGRRQMVFNPAAIPSSDEYHAAQNAMKTGDPECLLLQAE